MGIKLFPLSMVLLLWVLQERAACYSVRKPGPSSTSSLSSTVALGHSLLSVLMTYGL